ncbi:MAG: shikimate kinase [Actinomycetota bacterium]|nr:shikimate kinase [Actinomycetota bacterium]
MNPAGPRAIVLIGMMGSGKSAVGLALASRLGRNFVDVDACIEAGAGRQVATIFREEGEAGFREREREAIAEATKTENAVIACGGGAVLDPANVAHLKTHGTIVWLRVTPEVAAERLGTDQGRPVLQRMEGDLAERLDKLIAARAPAYESAADLTVQADGPVDQVAEAILRNKL